MQPTLYLVPTFLAETNPENVFPALNANVISQLQVFVVENLKTARRFISAICPEKNISQLEFYVINKKSTQEDWFDLVQLLNTACDIGLMSDAGLPAIADPGAELVHLAHQKNYVVKPLVGPSSIVMALMASGLNGQKFQFHGYLPIDKNQLQKSIRTIEQASAKEQSAQIFMDTPYRSDQLLNTLLNTCSPNTFLCVAANISGNQEQIKTQTISAWANDLPSLHKVPCIFILQAN